jgi:hypothetical protein
VEPQERTSEQVLTARASTTGSRRHAMRLLRDEYDEIVLVYELAGTAEGDPRTLVIEGSSGNSVTRVSHYPANWRQLRDADLLAMRARDA